MGTIIFDLDSTLIPHETLEEALIAKAKDEKTIQEIKKITEQGMAGEIDFLTSLKKRLALVPLHNEDLLPIIRSAEQSITTGVKEVIVSLMRDHEVWILSGAPREVAIAVGKALEIPSTHCQGVVLEWDQSGLFTTLDSSIPINRSKWEAAKSLAVAWPRPAIGVGDGMTDYALLEKGIIDHFIAFTQYKRRQTLLDKGVPEAKSISALQVFLKELLYGKA